MRPLAEDTGDRVFLVEKSPPSSHATQQPLVSSSVSHGEGEKNLMLCLLHHDRGNIGEKQWQRLLSFKWCIHQLRGGLLGA